MIISRRLGAPSLGQMAIRELEALDATDQVSVAYSSVDEMTLAVLQQIVVVV